MAPDGWEPCLGSGGHGELPEACSRALGRPLPASRLDTCPLGHLSRLTHRASSARSAAGGAQGKMEPHPAHCRRCKPSYLVYCAVHNPMCRARPRRKSLM